MNNSFFLLKQLASELNKKLEGWKLLACFSQFKDEIILGFAYSDLEEFYIRANLNSNLPTLSFPTDFNRAKRNSANLFPEIIGKGVTEIVVVPFDRSFIIQFDSGFSLLFKMHGVRANIVLFESNKVLRIFNNQFKTDWNLDSQLLANLAYPSFDFFIANGQNLSKTAPWLGPIAIKHLNNLGFERLTSPQMKWQLFEKLVTDLLNPKHYFLVRLEGRVHLSLLEIGSIIEVFQTPITGLNRYSVMAHQVDYLEVEKNEAIKILNRRIEQTLSYISKTESLIAKLELESRNSQIADIIMANLHAISTGSENVKLFDFYNDKDIEIRLKPEFSAQKNAENMYRKARNQKIEIDNTYQKLQSRTDLLASNRSQIGVIFNFSDVRELRKYLKTIGLAGGAESETEVLPYRKNTFQGFDILVGKNARSNDELTRNYAHKDDLWLHARDTPGSHVIIKHQSGKTFPVSVIEKAASIAAWNSKRKNESVCPVIVIEAKFVRKPKGSAPGMVTLLRERVIMVKPQGWE